MTTQRVDLDSIPLVGFDPGALFAALTESLRRTSERLAADFQALDHRLAAHEGAARLLGTRGWTVPMLMPIDAVEALAAEGSADELDSAFLEYYCAQRGAHFSELAADLRDGCVPAGWSTYLEQCLATYRRKHYLIGAAALFPLFEAVLRWGGMPKSDKDPKNFVAKRRRMSRPGFRRLAWASLDGFAQASFSSHNTLTPGGPLNRHAVLHGGMSPTWDQIDFLRLLQAVQTAGHMAAWGRSRAA